MKNEEIERQLAHGYRSLADKLRDYFDPFERGAPEVLPPQCAICGERQHCHLSWCPLPK